MSSDTEIIKRLGNIEYKLNYDLKKLSSFGIGGNARIVVFPKSKQEFVHALSVLRNPIVIGNGTNVLFSDAGVNAPIITTRKMEDEILIADKVVKVGAGTSLSKLCLQCVKRGLSGLENLYGIPATVGGAVLMNAGAFGREISDVLRSVVLYKNGKLQEVDAKDLEFGYRYSSIQKEFVIIEATFELSHGNISVLENKIKDNIMWRAEHQPVGKSAGSVFKKAEKPAGLLIDQAGLKGYRIGGAIVSKKHANFIINDNNANSSDVIDLINLIKNKVYMKFGVLLEEEIKYIGEQNGVNRGFSYP